ncbi:MAG: amino acid ABC transporter permease [Acidimicrobiia bacterium]
MAAPEKHDGASDPINAENHRRAVRALALALAVVVGVLVGAAIAALRADQTDNGFLAWFCLTLPLGVAALVYGRRAETRVVEVDGPLADEQRAHLARRISVGGVTLASLLVFGLAVWTSWDGLVDVANTFFSWSHISSVLGLEKNAAEPLEFGVVRDAFMLNVLVFIIAEVFVLALGLVVALARRLPGRAAAPLRWLAVAYVDVFRGLPAIVTIYLIVFGLPLTGLPIIEDSADIDFDFLGVHFDQAVVLGILAITLVYGAYVAEVYRAGIESIHWSQRAAARGLGLSEAQSMRHVVVPQAVRRVIPPLMNDFIGLQKDTALLNVAGILEGFNVARNNASNTFNLSAVTGLGLCFLIITIPQTRIVDYLARRDQRRMEGGNRMLITTGRPGAPTAAPVSTGGLPG